MSALWLALHFPLLPLEAESGPQPEPRAQVHAGRILMANPAAYAAGVEIGMRSATARALCDSLETQEATSPSQNWHQQAVLRREAHHLLALTPQVCLVEPATLLLEVSGCLKLFGGFNPLLTQVDRYRLHCPLTSRLGVGPTPLAAWHLTDLPALQGHPEPARFQAWLAALPLADLDLNQRLRERLQAPGFHSLGELFPLPRAALGKRFGHNFLDWLQRLLGEKPDPRQPISPPQRFRERLDFDKPLDRLGQINAPMRKLLTLLKAELDRQQASLTAIRWHLHLNNGHRDTLVVRRAHQGHDTAIWLDLSQRRLGHHELNAPVQALSLDSGHLRPRNPGLTELFPDPGARPPLAELLEKLVEESNLRIYRPAQGNGHLPEETELGRAPLSKLPKSDNNQKNNQDRPLWLLDPPRPLILRDQIPHWRGQPLTLFPQEEHFSQPWHHLAARHYRIAHHPDGHCCWVFEDDRQKWWLQGFF